MVYVILESRREKRSHRGNVYKSRDPINANENVLLKWMKLNGWALRGGGGGYLNGNYDLAIKSGQSSCFCLIAIREGQAAAAISARYLPGNQLAIIIIVW